ncbi:hypothetical protein JYU34_004352 [Plutella xylostella]|uniref:FLYWCH-type domain-containing protein n=1 Tax=Plutella xylostella TaxID=51655 RepID=A0ABQ7QXR4_PLUXY|nr:hypothetical protein JYU34_004352 [Plutella xylostella]
MISEHLNSTKSKKHIPSKIRQRIEKQLDESSSRREVPTEIFDVHNHEPPNYHITKEGRILIPSAKGKYPTLIYRKYSYGFSRIPNSCYIRWVCSRRFRGKCKAYLKAHSATIHVPTEIFDYTYNGFSSAGNTFFIRWVCSKKSRGNCKACLRSTVEAPDKPIATFGEHNHDPPKNKRGKCKAYLRANIETPDVLTTIFDVHNHEPPNYHITDTGEYGKHPTLIFRNYSYGFQKFPNANYIRWICSRRTRGKCKAYLKANSETPDVPTEIFDEHNHEPPKGIYPKLIFKNYRFNLKGNPNAPVIRWHCSKRFRGNCKASLRTFKDRPEEPTEVCGEHNHPPPKYFTKHTYSCDGNSRNLRYITWRCSRRRRGKCRAYLKTSKDKPETPIMINDDHNHKPPPYHVTEDGKYVKINICILIPSVKGKKPTLLFRKYSYGLQKEPKGAKGIVRWYCSRRSRGNCKACLKANRLLITVLGQKHPTLLFNNYFYCCHQENKCIRWICSKRYRGKCKAYIKAKKETPEIPIEIHGEHNHDPPDSSSIIKTKDGMMVPSSKGKHPMLVFNKYTYCYRECSGSVVRWGCSRRIRGKCKSVLKCAKDAPDTPIAVYGQHNHGPPLYRVTDEGYLLVERHQKGFP